MAASFFAFAAARRWSRVCGGLFGSPSSELSEESSSSSSSSEDSSFGAWASCKVEVQSERSKVWRGLGQARLHPTCREGCRQRPMA